MKQYAGRFTTYLTDLAAKKPAPGGGSVICLAFCLGVSLIEKAVNYSAVNISNIERVLKILNKNKKHIQPYIDLDGEYFEQIFKHKGARRNYFLKKSEKIIVDTGKACLDIFSLTQEIETLIKKSISSDFYIGLDLLKIALNGCIANLEANENIFGRDNKHQKIFKKIFSEMK